MPEQLTRKQVELVLRRAAELEQRDETALDTLTPQDLERVADELNPNHRTGENPIPPAIG